MFDVIVLIVYENRKISFPKDDNGNVVLYELIISGIVECI